MIATPFPRITLVQAPVSITSSPSGSLALLSAHLKRAGFSPVIRDSGLEIVESIYGMKTPLSGLEEFDLSDLNNAHDFLRSNSGFTTAFLDAEAGKILETGPDIVGFTVMVGTEEFSLALARRIKSRSPGIAVVFGGPQCLREAMADEIIQDAAVDAVAFGEADYSFVDFVRRYSSNPRGLPRTPGFLIREGGSAVDCGWPAEFENLDDLPFMDFDGFDLPRYKSGRLYLSTSRGCVRKCAFCTHIVQHKTYRVMGVQRTAAEIRHHFMKYSERNYVEFGDSLVNGNVRRLAELSDELARLRLDIAVGKAGRNFGWGGMAILHRTMTPGLLRKMRYGGCLKIFYGLESGSQKVVNLMRKNFSISDAEVVLRDTKSAGIIAGVFVMVGFPGETEEDFQETLDFIRRNTRSIGMLTTSICDIQQGSYLDSHAAEYGVELPLRDRLRWRLKDGSNTYEIRQDRHRRLIDCVRDSGKLLTGKPSLRVLN